MNEGRPCKVYLLNGDALQVYVSQKLYVEELLSIVADHCGIHREDRKYFSLACHDEKWIYFREICLLLGDNVIGCRTNVLYWGMILMENAIRQMPSRFYTTTSSRTYKMGIMEERVARKNEPFITLRN